MSDPIPDLSAVDSQQLLDGLADAVVVADEHNRVVYLNTSAERLLGWPRRQLIGRPLVTLVPERLRDRHMEGFERYLSTREGRLIGSGSLQVPALRADGQEVDVELTLTAHGLADGREVFVASLRDLSDRLALEQERAVSRYLLTMREITARLAAAGEATDLEQAAPIVLGAIGQSLGWDVGGLWVVADDQLRPLRHWAAPGADVAASAMVEGYRALSPGEGLPGRVLESREAVWIENMGQDPNFPRRLIADRHGLVSGFAFPIVAHGRVVAVVEFSSRTHRAAEPALLAAMATSGSEIGRLVERDTARRQAATSRDHLIGLAEALQASLLPPQPPSIPGLELATRYRAASGEGQVGGDFFDVFPLADGGWAVTVGDVSGRGPRAAALTALARYTIRAAAVGSTRGSDVLRVLNDVVLRELESTDELGERFLTVAYLVLEPSPEGVAVHLACGGHPAPLVLRDAGRVEEAACRGELIGAFDAMEVVDVDLALTPGDAMVLFTDGAIEGRGPEGQFGEDRLRDVVAGCRGLSAHDLAETLERAVLDYLGGVSQDDMAIVVLRLPAAGGGPGVEVVGVGSEVGA
jgi:PAS domain S-box-containing protein